MCRNIKNLRAFEARPTEEDFALAALQYVRKVSGYRVPSKGNKEAFDAAVLEIAASTGKLLSSLVVQPDSGRTRGRREGTARRQAHDRGRNVSQSKRSQAPR